MATIHFAFCGRVAVLRHANRAPEDSEWSRWVAALLEHQREYADRARVVISTDGGTPSPSQRRQLSAFGNAEGGLPTAVVSGRMPVRFIVSAIALFNHTIRAFSPDEADAAFAHLGLSPAECADVRRTLGALIQRLPD